MLIGRNSLLGQLTSDPVRLLRQHHAQSAPQRGQGRRAPTQSPARDRQVTAQTTACATDRPRVLRREKCCAWPVGKSAHNGPGTGDTAKEVATIHLAVRVPHPPQASNGRITRP